MKKVIIQSLILSTVVLMACDEIKNSQSTLSSNIGFVKSQQPHLSPDSAELQKNVVFPGRAETGGMAVFSYVPTKPQVAKQYDLSTDPAGAMRDASMLAK